jgi:regulator of nucleoside diphosphate kinase
MNSEVRLLRMDSGEMKGYKLVFPSQAGAENALSVLAPISTAILGYRVGDVIEWRVPKGVRRLRGSSLPAGSGRRSLRRGARCVIPARLGWRLEIPTLARAAGV